MSTPGLVALLAEGITPNQRALTFYGQILRLFEARGRVERGPWVASSSQNIPSVTWAITSAGRDWLAACDAAPVAAKTRRLESAAQAAARRDAAAARAAKLAEAAALYGRDTPVSVRRLVVRELREAGCTLEQVAGVFGVSREMIRLDQLSPVTVTVRRPPKLCPGSRSDTLFTQVSATVFLCLACRELVAGHGRLGAGGYRYAPRPHEPGPGLAAPCPSHAYRRLVVADGRVTCDCTAFRAVDAPNPETAVLA